MKLNMAICDDCAEDASYISNLINEWAKRASISIDVTVFVSAEQYLFEHEASNPFDILILDIEMKSVSGIELAKKIRKTDKRVEIIFTTSHFEFISEGYEVDALHYLIKPVKPQKLFDALHRAVERISEQPKKIIFQCDGETVRLAEDEITYIESFLHYIVIHTPSNQYKIKESISVFAGNLTKRFFRIHRSYIASLTYIVRISRTNVILSDGTVLPLSRGQYDAVNLAFIEQN